MTAPQRLTDRKREAIVAAAIAEFRANGFEVTSMDKIAATAGDGVSPLRRGAEPAEPLKQSPAQRRRLHYIAELSTGKGLQR